MTWREPKACSGHAYTIRTHAGSHRRHMVCIHCGHERLMAGQREHGGAVPR